MVLALARRSVIDIQAYFGISTTNVAEHRKRALEICQPFPGLLLQEKASCYLGQQLCVIHDIFCNETQIGCDGSVFRLIFL